VGYTYCVELSADEAIQAGAREVRFDRPLAFYVENFIGFPVGMAVPTGYYDRVRALWVPSPNGRVVQVTGILNNLAGLDTDGDGALSKAEAESAKMSRLLRDFDKLDKNKDGKLTADEMAAAPHHKMMPQP